MKNKKPGQGGSDLDQALLLSPTMKNLTHKPTEFQDTIQALEFKPVNDRGALKAFCTVHIGSLQINDCRIIQQPGQRAWLSMPSISYKNQYGTVSYRTLVEIKDKNLKDLISQTVLTEWEKFIKGGNNNGRKE